LAADSRGAEAVFRIGSLTTSYVHFCFLSAPVTVARIFTDKV
jgi:hypothetical protein